VCFVRNITFCAVLSLATAAVVRFVFADLTNKQRNSHCVRACVFACKQQAPNGFSEFCVRDIGSAGDGRREIQLAERGNELARVQFSLTVSYGFPRRPETSALAHLRISSPVNPTPRQ